MPKPKGGRGHAAPYDTKLMRVPVPLESQIHELIDRYQDFIDQGGTPLEPPPLLDAIADAPVRHGEIEELRLMILQLEDQRDKLVNELSASRQKLAESEDECKRYKNDCQSFENTAIQWHNIANEYLEELDLLRNKPVNELTDTADKPVNELTDTADKPVNELTDTADKPVNELTDTADKPVNELTDTADKPVNELTDTADKPTKKIKGLNQQQLANLFGLSHTAVGKHKLRETFIEWSKQHDPSGQAWKYDQKSKMFYSLAD